MLAKGRLQNQQVIIIRLFHCPNRPCHFCMTFDLEEECYICYAFWVPYEVYIKDFSKFHCFPPVLSSWWSSIHLLELKIQMWRIPPCHTSKVASWHVHWRYELHLFPSISKIVKPKSKSKSKSKVISQRFGLRLTL